MTTLMQVITEVAHVVRGVPSVVYAPNTPPSNVSDDFDLPAALIYPANGGDTLGAHGTSVAGGHPVSRSVTLMIQLGMKQQGVDAQQIAVDVLNLHEPLALALMTAWISHNFNNTVPFLGLVGQSSATPIRWEYAAFDWGGTGVLGFQYEIDLTYQEEVMA